MYKRDLVLDKLRWFDMPKTENQIKQIYSLKFIFNVPLSQI